MSHLKKVKYVEKKQTRRLSEKLNIIGQNNIKSMYMEINEKQDN